MDHPQSPIFVAKADESAPDRHTGLGPQLKVAQIDRIKVAGGKLCVHALIETVLIDTPERKLSKWDSRELDWKAFRRLDDAEAQLLSVPADVLSHIEALSAQLEFTMYDASDEVLFEHVEATSPWFGGVDGSGGISQTEDMTAGRLRPRRWEKL